MHDHLNVPAPHLGLTRREALARLSLVVAGLAAACTPVRFVLHDYPDSFDDDAETTDRVLRAFVLTIIPGASPDDPNLARPFSDERLPFARFHRFFAADLSRRAQERYSGEAFDTLDTAQRTQVIQAGLAGDPECRRLYQGAIVLAQVAFYAGIYDDARGCALIGYPGRFTFDAARPLSFDEPERFMAPSSTPDGNPA